MIFYFQLKKKTSLFVVQVARFEHLYYIDFEYLPFIVTRIGFEPVTYIEVYGDLVRIQT